MDWKGVQKRCKLNKLCQMGSTALLVKFDQMFKMNALKKWTRVNLQSKLLRWIRLHLIYWFGWMNSSPRQSSLNGARMYIQINVLNECWMSWKILDPLVDAGKWWSNPKLRILIKGAYMHCSLCAFFRYPFPLYSWIHRVVNEINLQTTQAIYTSFHTLIQEKENVKRNHSNWCIIYIDSITVINLTYAIARWCKIANLNANQNGIISMRNTSMWIQSE